MKNRFISLSLAALLLMGALTGCGSSKDKEPDNSEEVTGSIDPSQEADDSVSATAAAMNAAYAKYDPDTVVMTMNGEDVTWEEYFYWLQYPASQFAAGGKVDWSIEFDDGKSYGDYCKYYAEEMIKQYGVIDAAAYENNIVFTDADKQSLADIEDQDISDYGEGDRETFINYLATLNLSYNMYTALNTTAVTYPLLFASFYGSEGERLTDEEVIEYAETEGILSAKHILFMTVDSEGTPLDDEAVASQRALAEETLAELKACTSQEEIIQKFDTLMNERSEDTGLVSNPNGYVFGPGQMVTEFETATAALGDYEVSEIVESSYGYHIILSLPIEADDVPLSTSYTIRYLAASAQFNEMLKGWLEEAVIEYKDDFQNLNMEELFPTLTAESAVDNVEASTPEE